MLLCIRLFIIVIRDPSVLSLQDHTSGRHRGFAFVMFEEQSSVAKVVAPQGNTQLHEIRPGKYIEAKHAVEKDSVDRGAEDAIRRASTKSKLKNMCMDCGKNNPKFCMPNGVKLLITFTTLLLWTTAFVVLSCCTLSVNRK
jgi:hypothetical protein|eukprot:COSAG02_NODE_328_length_24547_cov_4.124141_25_plen_141_part_00